MTTIADKLAALIPQMREDAECHRSWTTEAAREDLDGRHFDRPVRDVVGDVAWHERWTKFYNECADTMEEAVVALRSPDSTREGGFCTDCGFEVETFEGLDKCPKCGSVSIPCAWEDQVQVSINWHELHILVVWAENYGRQIDGQDTIFAIAKRLEKQLPSYGALTLAGELAELRKQFPGTTTSDGDLNHDIQEKFE